MFVEAAHRARKGKKSRSLAILGAFFALASVVLVLRPVSLSARPGYDPLLITVRQDPQGAGEGFSTATQSARGLDAALHKAGNCDSLFAASKSVGAVDVTQSIGDLVLEGHTRHVVTIVDMRAKVLTREPPLTGALIDCYSSGTVPAVGIQFNLDEPSPVARRATRFPLAGGDPYFGSGNIVTLRSGEVQPLQITARLRHGYVKWKIIADVIIDGTQREITIDDHGHPFQLTSAPTQTLAGYSR